MEQGLQDELDALEEAVGQLAGRPSAIERWEQYDRLP